VPWVKLDDGFVMHPKITGLSDRAFRTLVFALCFAARFLTDGVVPKHELARFSAAGLRDLLAAGLLEDHGASVQVHDFLDYNRSRAQWEEERRSAAERQAKSRRDRDRTSRRDFDSPVRVRGVPSEHLARARAQEGLPPAPQPPRFRGRCDECGFPVGHDPNCSHVTAGAER